MMSGQISAEIGHWYRPSNNDDLFEVVAIDYDKQLIEIQCFDGDIEEIEFNAWKVLIPAEIAPPEDWSEPYEIGREDPVFNSYALDEALTKLDKNQLSY